MKKLFIQLLYILILTTSIKAQDNDIAKLKNNFVNPPTDCWPHTRWWWPGNPVSKEEITWQLEQMRSHGIRGVEQISMGAYYEKGNIPYLSDEYLEMAKHTVAEAKRLGMEVSFNFGGPGWIMGGDWIPEEDKSKDLIPTSVIVEGPFLFNAKLPDVLTKTKRSWELYEPNLSGEETLLCVVAGKITGLEIDKKSLIVITQFTNEKNLKWNVPEGKWRIMAFWLAKNGHSNAVDHFNKGAMERFCETLGNKYKKQFGEEFGKTVDSFFGDSFELPNLASGIYWSTGLLEDFEKRYGYDLIPYLPAVWWEVSDISPKIRYDVNEFSHQIGMEAFFETFMGWCEENGIKGRVQTYGFSTDNIEAAGKTHIPEMEITAGEKDAMEWFDTRIGPKKYVASGAHIYGRKVVSTEAYTFLHWERYRGTLQELKIASDMFLKNGATKFYNHGFTFSPEREVAPSRSTGWAAYIHPNNVWWKYYPKLAEYIARSSYLLRQGDFVADIAVYSPLANQWTLDALNARKWTREFDWGDLGKLIISNGYDFDLVNDDAIQNLASIEDGNIKINKQEYKLLILPNIEAMPLKSLEFVEEYVKNGGTVIALERVPNASTGFMAYKENDKKVQEIAALLFDSPRGRDANAEKKYGDGTTYQIKQVLDRSIWWDKRSSTLDPFVNTIRKHITPDFSIDFAQEGIRKNEGLTYQHRQLGDTDIYFVTNIQNKKSEIPVTFRVKNKNIEKWNPNTGEVSGFYHFNENKNGITIPLELEPFESTFLLFKPGTPKQYVSQTGLYKINIPEKNKIEAIAINNGTYFTTIQNNKKEVIQSIEVKGIPSPYEISGEWELTLDSKQFPKTVKTLTQLTSWTKDELTKHFSGTGKYKINFNLPLEYFEPDLDLNLDLGKVGNVAEVILNGQNMGTVWMTGQKPDITKSLKNGENELIVFVTNTLINQVSAYKEPVPVPRDLVARFGSAPTQTPGQLPREFGFKPLPASGLLGPVKIIPQKRINLLIE
ncbi:MAG: hypothetical protein HQ522_19675 [Bacteroidetes bacterium]|nr:hypothetical protein [Bacteroidota bacterium]